MILADVKTQTESSSPLNISSSDKEPTLSFSDLLKGVVKDGTKNSKNGALLVQLGVKGKDAKTDSKVVQNGMALLSLGTTGKGKDNKIVLIDSSDKKTDSKNEGLSALLKNTQATDGELKTNNLVEINPKITQALTTKDVKTLVLNAKEYLKTKIINSDGYKKIQNEELPKTLKGLASLAKSIGINISKITIEDVQVAKASMGETNELGIKTDTKNKIPLDDKKLQTQTVVDVKDKKLQTQNILETKVETPKILAGLKQAPLFKAQTQIEHTTEQIVQTKQLKIEDKTPKEKADFTLKQLLNAEKPASVHNVLSPITKPVATQSLQQQSSDTLKSLETMLKGESSVDQNNSSNAKIEGMTTHKANSLEVKLNEAKQMVKYISQDVKTAIEDYKSPFTRVKVQLNPQKLGDIELVVVQRGKNLHVSLSSNNAAINTLSLNANELRTQLNNNGINNATLNFNNNSQNGDTHSSQQQNRNNERKADEEYNYFEKEEENEEVLSSLEIIVPHYA